MVLEAASTTQIVSPTETNDVLQVVRRILGESDRPLSVNQIHKQLPAGLRPRKEQLELLLTDAVRAGQVFSHGTYRRNHVFLDRTIPDYAREQLQKLLSREKLLLSQIRKKVKNVSAPELTQILDDLVATKQVHRHPPVGRSRAWRYSALPIDPVDYLRQPVAKVQQMLVEAGVSGAELAEALRGLAEELGAESSPARAPSEASPSTTDSAAALPPATWPTSHAGRQPDTSPASTPSPSAPLSPQPSAEPAASKTPASNEDLAQRILDRMKLVDSRADEGAMIPISELRRLNDFQHEDRAEFDLALWQLVRARKLALHEHGSVGLLTEQQRADHLVDERGRHYHAVSRRRGS